MLRYYKFIGISKKVKKLATILLVDDSRFLQNLVKKVLLTYMPESRIVTADNGLQALEVYSRERPDLIVTDLLMPHMKGQELIRKIREQDQKTKIVVLTADIQKAVRDEVELMGITALINKPIDDEKAALLAKLAMGDN